jgi:hypothetical protein
MYFDRDNIGEISWRKARLSSDGCVICVPLEIPAHPVAAKIQGMVARQRPAFFHFLETLSFCQIILRAHLHCRHHLDPSDEILLPRRHYPSSRGAIRYA